MPPWLVAALVGTTALIWFTLLSGWIGVTPGSVLVKRQNVLFNSDTSTWIGEMVGPSEPSASSRAIHPFDVLLWRPPCRAVARLLQIALSPDRAALLAARLVVALVAGAGVGLLAWFALTAGVRRAHCLLLFAMYLLFTSSVTIALPEHFGLSNGLLSSAFVAPIMLHDRKARATVLGLLVPWCGGTTLTNGLYPLLALYHWGLPSSRARRVALVAAAGVVAIGGFIFVDSEVLIRPPVPGVHSPFGFSHQAILPAYVPAVSRWYLKTTKLHGHVLDFMNMRIVGHPADAAGYAIFALVAPAVGPVPAVRTAKGASMVTYESEKPLQWSAFGYSGYDALHFRDYWSLHGIGAALWLSLFVTCTFHAVRDPRTRPAAWLPAGWILFNIVFHNVWGDELFLYAPHWSWALMALVILGARRVPLVTIVLLFVPIAFCQVYTLTQVKYALSTIVR
jgi:hypothetical protein